MNPEENRGAIHESLPFEVSWIPSPSLGALSFVNNDARITPGAPR